MAQITRTFATPGGTQTHTLNIPKEGEIFTVSGRYQIYRVVNGKIEYLNPNKYLLAKGMTQTEIAQKYPNLSAVNEAVAQELGVSMNDLPQYNEGDFGTAGLKFSDTQSDGSDWDFSNIKGGDFSQNVYSGHQPDSDASIAGGQDFGTYINAQGNEVKATSEEMQKDFELLGFDEAGAKAKYPTFINAQGKEVTPTSDEELKNMQDLKFKEVGAEEKTSGERLLGPTEYENLVKENQVTEANFDQYFRRDDKGNIYLKADAPSPTEKKGVTSGTGWVDPATGKESAEGSGVPVEQYNQQQGNEEATQVEESGDILDIITENLDPNASDEEILEAVTKIKEGQIDPYYKQLIDQIQSDIVKTINRGYEDRIRQLQTESYRLAENIKGTQTTLEAQGMTFSGEAIRQLGPLAAFGAAREESLTPGQLQPQADTMPTMTPEQAGIEGITPMANRLIAESSRTAFNRGLENIGQEGLRMIGTTGMAGLGLPAAATAGQPYTTGSLEYNYINTLQNLYSGVSGQQDVLTKELQQPFL